MNSIFKIILDCFLDSLVDSLKILPFLFLTFFIMEYIEHKSESKMQSAIAKAGKGGPFVGAILGAFPQCGFSAAASNFYAGRVITLGTLISIYLSTSDEMLPIMLSRNVEISIVLKFIIVKIIIGMIAGFILDFVFKNKDHDHGIEHLCEKHHCHCEKGLFRSTLSHTIEIFSYILGISFALCLIISFIGEDAIAGFIFNKPLIGEFLAAIIGLIPNCAGSVVITQLYLSNVISFGAAISGLLSGCGVGILVLFKVNDNRKENLKILAITYCCAVVFGSIAGLFFK